MIARSVRSSITVRLTRSGRTISGWTVFVTSRRSIFAMIRCRTTLIEPPVEPAEGPIMMTAKATASRPRYVRNSSSRANAATLRRAIPAYSSA
jgi:hypothetical protein